MNTTRPSQDIVKLTGTIRNYQVRRASASFVFTDMDKTKLGVVAVAAGMVGLGGQAVATATYAASSEEDADYVEFNLDGQLVKGWVWRSPFKEGDQVEVIGEMHGAFFGAAAIARPVDRIVALYPHCSRGTLSHIKNSVKWWVLGSTILLAICAAIMLVIDAAIFLDSSEEDVYVAFGVYAFFALMTYSLARKWMPFVRVAEKVFTALGWTDPGNVDLVKSSRAQRRPDDPGELGTFYFRY